MDVILTVYAITQGFAVEANPFYHWVWDIDPRAFLILRGPVTVVVIEILHVKLKRLRNVVFVTWFSGLVFACLWAVYGLCSY